MKSAIKLVIVSAIALATVLFVIGGRLSAAPVMDSYTQKVVITFKTPAAALAARVEIAPLYHDYRAAFSSRWDDNNVDNDPKVHAIMAQFGQKGTFFLNDPADTHGTNRALLEGDNSLGVHTLTHPYLTAIARNRAFEEILGERIALEVDAQTPVMSFAYPFLNYRSEFDPAGSQADLVDMIERSGIYYVAENTNDFAAFPDLLTARYISLDGNPWQGTSLAAEEARLGDLADSDRPLLLSTMHPWPSAWGDGFPKLIDEYKTWSDHADWWYCNQNQYGAYRYQFLHTTLKPAVAGKTVTILLTRLGPLDLGDLVPLTLKVGGAAASDIVSVKSPVAAVSFPNPASLSTFDLPHDRSLGLPDAYGRIDNPSNRFDAAGAQSAEEAQEVKVLFCQEHGELVLAIRNISAAPITDLRVLFRLPLRWKAGVIARRIARIEPGAAQTIRVKLQAGSDDPVYSGGDEFDAAQIDFRSDRRVRLYATCTVKSNASDPSYPQNGFLVLGPLPRDNHDFDYGTFVQKLMAEQPLSPKFQLFAGISVAWQAPDSAQTVLVDPNVAYTTGHSADLSFYTWDPSIYCKYGKDLHYVLWTTVESPTARTVAAVYSKSCVEELMVNGVLVPGDKIELKSGSNDIRILYQPVRKPGFAASNYGAYFRLNDSGGSRLTDIRYVRPEVAGLQSAGPAQ